MADKYDYLTKTKKEERNHIIKIGDKNIRSSIEYNPRPNSPKNLFKYHACNEHSLSALKENEIWASNPSSFNDPFDCSPQLWEGRLFPFGEIKEILKLVLLSEQVDSCKNNNQLRELFFNTIKDFIGIYCLNEGRNEELFWAYYGDDHKGIKIKYKQKILSRFWETAPLKLEYLELDELINQRMKVNRNLSRNFHKIFPQLIRWVTVKKKTWVHESEWRYIFWVSPSDQESRKQRYPRNAIKSITLGYKFFESSNVQYIHSGVFKHVFEIKEGCGNNQINYHLEILNFLKDHSDYPLYQIALDENMKLYPQQIYINEINDSVVTIFREFPPEQLKVMDAKV